MPKDVIDVTGLLKNKSGGSSLRLIVTGIIAIALLVVIHTAWQNIRPGYVGIVFDKFNHNVTARQLEPGWAFINPFTQAIREYPVTIQTYSMVLSANEGRVSGDDSIKVQSNEGQQLNLDVVIQYRVIKEEAAALYQDWGGAPISQIQDGAVRQYTRSQVPVICAKYGWEDVAAGKRADVVEEISSVLTREFKTRHLSLVSFGIREVHLPATLQAALNQKIQAQQAAEQQKYQLKQAQIKAEQDVAEATGKANALKMQAEGEATATLTRAKAQAEANDLLSKSLTSDLIRYSALQRWDGRVPMLTGSSVPLIDVGQMLGDQKTGQLK